MPRSKPSVAIPETEGSFPFIISSGPGVIKDPNLRTLIRKQAMKDVGLARKRRGNYGRSNTRQPVAQSETNDQIEQLVSEVSGASLTSSGSSRSTPDTFNSSTTSNTTSSTEPLELDMDDPANWTIVSQRSKLMVDFLCTLPKSPSLSTGYECARSRYGIDLTQLSLMTNFNMTAHAFQTFSTNPTRLLSLMEDKQWSYLEFVPSMYDSNRCLAAATDCLLAGVANVLAPYNADANAGLRLYAKALRAVQEAIANPSSSTEAETLCAIQLMSLFELLEPEGQAAWAAHTKGAARLVKHRTTERFKSEFEKALFAGHAGPLVSEALVGNTHCYLAETAWLELYSSLVQDTAFLTERSELIINSRKLMFKVPGLWHDVGKALQGEDLFDDIVLASLESLCRQSHAGYLDWLEQYKLHCLRTSLAQPPPGEIGMRREIFGASLECLCIVKRLLACVCEADRRGMEPDSQALARFVLDLQKQPSPKHSWLFTPHEVGLAMSIQASQESFEEDLREQDLETRKLAMRRRYFAWNGLLRAQ